MPVPPRTCVLRASSTAQLNPARGDQRMFGSGSLAVSNWTLCPFSSRNVSPSAAAFVKPVSPKNGTSNLMPAVILRFPRGDHSSCA